jgi:hypothetical protein
MEKGGGMHKMHFLQKVLTYAAYALHAFRSAPPSKHYTITKIEVVFWTAIACYYSMNMMRTFPAITAATVYWQ